MNRSLLIALATPRKAGDVLPVHENITAPYPHHPQPHRLPMNALRIEATGNVRCDTYPDGLGLTGPCLLLGVCQATGDNLMVAYALHNDGLYIVTSEQMADGDYKIGTPIAYTGGLTAFLDHVNGGNDRLMAIRLTLTGENLLAFYNAMKQKPLTYTEAPAKNGLANAVRSLTRHPGLFH